MSRSNNSSRLVKWKRPVRANSPLECKRPSPLLGYPGGKSRVACEITKHFPPHDGYVEPMGGGASVLLAKRATKKDVLGDKNPEIVKLYRAAQSGILCKRLISSQKAERRLIARNSQDACDIVAKRIGSFAKKGRHPSRAADYPLRVNWPSQRVATRLKGVTLRLGDYKDTMERHDGPRVLHYLDPPYPDGSEYGPGLNDVDPREVKDTAMRMKGAVAISYPDKPKIREMYCARRSQFRCIRIPTPVLGTGQGAAGYRNDLLIIKPSLGMQRQRTRQR
jgi:DNA adenine methylase